jgi:glycosyltransferase involved in cell wall biosynthesis
MKRVAIVTDHTFEEHGWGGLEVTQKELAARAPKDIEVRFVSYDSLGEVQKREDGTHDLDAFAARAVEAVAGSDLVVFTNVARWPRSAITPIAKGLPYVKMEFDWGFCRTHLKNCEEDCKACVADGWYKEFLEGAQRIFFTCPMQKDWYRKILGSVADNSILNPSWIDPDAWPNRGLERDPNLVMFHGNLFLHKGPLEIAQMAVLNPDIRFVIVGAGPDEVMRRLALVRNVHALGRLDHDTLVALLNRAKHWFMLSQWDDTGPAAALEAYLCGAELNHNGRLGYLSYPWDWKEPESVRAELRQIPARFWGEIQAILKGP